VCSLRKGTDCSAVGGAVSKQTACPFLGAILGRRHRHGRDKGRRLSWRSRTQWLLWLNLASRRGLAAASRTSNHGAKAFAWTWETGTGEPAGRECHPTIGLGTTAIGFRLRDTRTLSVLWQDGQPEPDFDVRDLRLACRCAVCVEGMSGPLSWLLRACDRT